MSTPPIPITDFAAKVRTKYPGAYDHLSDPELVQKVVDKYPDYKQHIASYAETDLEKNQPQPGVLSPIDPNAQGVVQRTLGSAGAALMTAPGAVIAAGMDPVGTATKIAKGVASSAATWANPATRPTWEGIKSVLPEAIGGGIGSVAANEVGGAIPKAYSGIRSAAYTPEGLPSPMASSVGEALEHPTQIPGKLAVGVAKKLFPPPAPKPVYPGGSLPLADDFYAARGQELNNMRKMQPDAYAPTPPEPSPTYPGGSLPTYEDYALNRGKEISSMIRQQPDAFAPPPSEPPPVYAGGSLPTYEDYAANRGAEINAIRRQQPNAFAPPAPPPPELGSPENPGFMSKLPARLPPNLRGDPFSPTPSQAASPIRTSPFEAPSRNPQGQIVSPESQPPHVEGSYWSFKEGALRKAVLGGDRDAAVVYKQRFGDLPPGAGYLTDVGQAPNRGLYKSRTN